MNTCQRFNTWLFSFASKNEIKVKLSDFINFVGTSILIIKIVSYYLSWSLEAKPDFDVFTLGFALLNLVGLGGIEDFELLLESLFTLEQPCKTTIKRLNTKARTQTKSNLGRGYQWKNLNPRIMS